MGHIYLSHSHSIAIYACPIPWDVSHEIPIGMTFPWTIPGCQYAGYFYYSENLNRATQNLRLGSGLDIAALDHLKVTGESH